ncbi:uncharacterized protein TNCV_1030091 [Trichonephila clavipes]|nr:uncharacterized protein TNCV_1030091 [Trichonephila clavipes]
MIFAAFSPNKFNKISGLNLSVTLLAANARSNDKKETPPSGTKLPTQQYFLQTPKDLTAVEGSTVDLQCQVGALAGDVQWSKDGFLLGKWNWLL